MIDESIEAVRRISSGLRPLVLDHLGLEAALNEEAVQFSRRSGIECRLTTEGMDGQLPNAIETAAFRIFQESLTNVARHAEASKVDAECAVREGLLLLRIRDDGVGMDAAAVNNPGSLGLLGMLERAAGVGGHLEFSTAPGIGTEVFLTLPIPDATPHETSTPPLP
jgi:signal transduction histidine kinase